MILQANENIFIIEEGYNKSEKERPLHKTKNIVL